MEYFNKYIFKNPENEQIYNLNNSFIIDIPLELEKYVDDINDSRLYNLPIFQKIKEFWANEKNYTEEELVKLSTEYKDELMHILKLIGLDNFEITKTYVDYVNKVTCDKTISPALDKYLKENNL